MHVFALPMNIFVLEPGTPCPPQTSYMLKSETLHPNLNLNFKPADKTTLSSGDLRTVTLVPARLSDRSFRLALD